MNKYFTEDGREVRMPDKQLSNHQRVQKYMAEQSAKVTEPTPVEPKKPTQAEVDAIAERMRNGDEEAEEEGRQLLAGKTQPLQPIEKKEVAEPDQNALRNAYQDELDAMSKTGGSKPFLYHQLQAKYRAQGLKI